MGIEALQKLTRADVEMDGIVYTVRPPRLQDCIAAGDIPLPVLDELAEREQPAEGETPKMADVVPTAALNDTYVRLAVVAVDGDPVELTLDDVRDIPEHHYGELLALARRRKPIIPGKVSRPLGSSSSPEVPTAGSTDGSVNGTAVMSRTDSTTT